MKMRKNYFNILILFLFINSAFAQNDTTLISFENALSQMLKHNPALKSMNEKVNQKRLSKKVKTGLYMPKVSLSAKAMAMSDRVHLDLNEVKDAITPLYDAMGNYGVFNNVPNPDPASNQVMPILNQELSTQAVRQQLLEGGETIEEASWDKTIQDQNFASVTADFIWPVFTGGKIKAANQAAGVDIELSEVDYSITESKLISELVERYYGLILTNQVVKVWDEANLAMEVHFQNARKMYEGGMIAKTELLHAKVSKSESVRNLNKAIHNVNTLQAGLSATLASENSLYLPTNNLFVCKNLPDKAYWIDLMKKNNPYIRKVECNKELVNIQKRVTKGNYLPTVAIMGTYNITEYQFSPYLPEWLVGAGVNWSVFEGLARGKKMKQTTSMAEEVKYTGNKVESNLELYVVNIHNQLLTQLSEISELENTISLANEYCESTQKAFNQGLATSETLVKAQSKVTQAKALRLKAFYEYDVILAKLLEVAGVSNQFIIYSNSEDTVFESLKN